MSDSKNSKVWRITGENQKVIGMRSVRITYDLPNYASVEQPYFLFDWEQNYDAGNGLAAASNYSTGVFDQTGQFSLTRMAQITGQGGGVPSIVSATFNGVTKYVKDFTDRESVKISNAPSGERGASWFGKSLSPAVITASVRGDIAFAFFFRKTGYLDAVTDSPVIDIQNVNGYNTTINGTIISLYLSAGAVGKPKFRYRGVNDFTGSAYAAMNDGNWHHFYGTYALTADLKTASANFYVDGFERSAFSYKGAALVASASSDVIFSIGSSDLGTPGGASYQLSDVVFLTSTLTQPQISQSYAAFNHDSVAGQTYIRYKMDEPPMFYEKMKKIPITYRGNKDYVPTLTQQAGILTCLPYDNAAYNASGTLVSIPHGYEEFTPMFSTGTFTLHAWCSATAPGFSPMLLSYGGGGLNTEYYRLQYVTGTTATTRYWTMSYNPSGTMVGHAFTSSLRDSDIGRSVFSNWEMISHVVSSSDLPGYRWHTFYRNGIPGVPALLRVNSRGTQVAESGSFTFGGATRQAYGAPSGLTWAGKIGTVKIYNRAMSTTEISALYTLESSSYTGK